MQKELLPLPEPDLCPECLCQHCEILSHIPVPVGFARSEQLIFLERFCIGLMCKQNVDYDCVVTSFHCHGYVHDVQAFAYPTMWYKMKIGANDLLY